MQKAATFLLSSFTHIIYFTIVLQAFVVRWPPECLCAPANDAFSFVSSMKTLVVYNIPEPTHSGSIKITDHGLKSDDDFCPGSIPTSNLALKEDMTLGPQLENLLTTVLSRVQVCLKLNKKGQVLKVATSNRDLSAADEQLISKYIAQNWSFNPSNERRTTDISGYYALNLSVRTDQKVR